MALTVVKHQGGGQLHAKRVCQALLQLSGTQAVQASSHERVIPTHSAAQHSLDLLCHKGLQGLPIHSPQAAATRRPCPCHCQHFCAVVRASSSAAGTQAGASSSIS